MSKSKAKKVASNPVSAYFQNAFEEFRKVTWPTKEQVAVLTAVTIGVSIITILFIAGLDLGFGELYQLLLDNLS